ncbi:MAG: hypothetical protein V4649_04095 [Bacteroidota bacterium]
MDSSELRERLHEFINTADEQHLSAIYTLVEDKLQARTDVYDDEVMKMLNERRQNHLNGTSKSYSATESIEMILRHKK